MQEHAPKKKEAETPELSLKLCRSVKTSTFTNTFSISAHIRAKVVHVVIVLHNSDDGGFLLPPVRAEKKKSNQHCERTHGILVTRERGETSPHVVPQRADLPVKLLVGLDLLVHLSLELLLSMLQTLDLLLGLIHLPLRCLQSLSQLPRAQK